MDKWGDLIDNTDLSDIQKKAIRVRVLSVVERLRDRLFYLTIGYTLLRTNTTVGSLLVPSLLAVQSNVNQEVAYWSMWGIGLLVSLSNAFISLFRIDKNYFTIGDLIERIESESWMYLTLSSRYKRDDEEGYSGHRDMFSQFMERCETLINKAIRTEYTPGQYQSGSRSVIHSFAGKTVPRVNDPYETVLPQVDDKHIRGASDFSDSPRNIRRQRSPSDSTDETGGVSGEAPGVVSAPTRPEGVQIELGNRRVLGHNGEGSTN